MADRDITLNGFYPLAFLARFFGLFPFSNFGSNLKSPGELKCRIFRLDILATLFFLSIFAYRNYCFMEEWQLFDSETFKEKVISIFCNGHRINCIIVYCHFLSKNHQIVRLFQRFDPEVQFLPKRYNKFLMVAGFGWTFFVTLIISLHGTLYIISQTKEPVSRFSQFCTIYIGISTCFIFTFIAAFIAYMNLVFFWSFDNVATETVQLTKSYTNDLNLSNRLRYLRNRHEQLILLVEELNSILVIILPVLISALSVGICVGIFELLWCILRPAHAKFKITSLLLFPMFRFSSLSAVCVTSNMMSTKAKDVAKHLNGYYFEGISHKCEFQVSMMISQCERRRAKLTLLDVVNVDSRLLAKSARLTAFVLKFLMEGISTASKMATVVTKVEDLSIENAPEALMLGFYPLAILGRCFGYFPLSNIGGRGIKKSSELRVKICRIDALITLSFLAIALYSNYEYFIRWEYPQVDNFKTMVLSVYFVIYRLLSIIILFHFALFRRKSFLLYIQRLSSIENNINFEKRKNNIRNLGYSLATSLVISTAVYSGCYIMSFDMKLEFDDIANAYIVVCALFSYNFVGALLIFLSKCIHLCFDDIADELDVHIVQKQNSPEFSQRLSAIRKRHEELVTSAEVMNSIMSPVLTIFIMAQSISICVNLYEFCYYVAQRRPYMSLILTAVFTCTRLIPLIAVCITSSALMEKANTLAKPLRSCDLKNLSKDSKFQVITFMKQMERRKIELSADDIFVIDNRLLAEIFGAIITYNVVMMEISSGKSTSQSSS
ncbi:hypothetical protein CHUAL_007056 [Chamberlinius hualienensis]